MSLLILRQFIIVLLLSIGLISHSAHASWKAELFELFIKRGAKEEAKIIPHEAKLVEESSGFFDDFAKWIKRLFGIPVDTKLENELAKRFGDYAKKKVRNETKECAIKIYKANQNNPNKSKNKKTEEEARNSCAGGVLNCLNVNYRNVKNPTNQMFDRCIKEINTNIYRYIKVN